MVVAFEGGFFFSVVYSLGCLSSVVMSGMLINLHSFFASLFPIALWVNHVFLHFAS